MPEIRQVFKHGGSLCMTFPPQFAAAVGIRPGDVTIWRLGKDGKITIEKLQERETNQEVGLSDVHNPSKTINPA